MEENVLVEKDLDLLSVDEEVNSWIRNIYFIWQGDEQFAEVKWEEGWGYELISSEFTEAFKEFCELHDIEEDSICSLLDDLTYQKVSKGNTWRKEDN